MPGGARGEPGRDLVGWLLIAGLAGAVLLALWRFGRFDAAALQLLGAALFFAVAGYALQGKPGLAGRPLPPPQARALPTSAAQGLGPRDPAAAWLDAADRHHQAGDARGAADVLRSAVAARPGDADLWVGYGNALVIFAQGQVVPAAQLAFGRAGQLVPDHPALPYFQGLALAQGGKIADARRIWTALLASAPPDAAWRAMVEARLATLPPG